MSVITAPSVQFSAEFIAFAKAAIALDNAQRIEPMVAAIEPVKPVVTPSNDAVKPARKTRSDKGVKRGPRKPITASKPVVKAEPVKAESKPVAKNWAGRFMLSSEGTATTAQREFLAAHGQDAEMCAAISMVDASNYRALVTGKITAAQYNAL